MFPHKNNIGFLRLVFASLVIIGHAPEQIDGNRHRELLTLIFHTFSLGDLAVDGFFLLSGFLITMSWTRASSLSSYFQRRILRIWPGYIVACLLCTLALGPLVGGHPFTQGVSAFIRMVFLQGPIDSSGQLAGLPYPVLNGAAWTIPIEFGCYTIVALLGLTAILEHRGLMIAFALIAAGLSIVPSFDAWQASLHRFGHPGLAAIVLGRPMHLTAVFLIGALGYLYRQEITAHIRAWTAALALGIGVTLAFNPHFGEIGLALFGGISLFWLCFHAHLGPLQKINDQWDISYGTYLYGWPIAITILYFHRDIQPPALAAISLPLALLAGCASWWLIEKRAKDLFKSSFSLSDVGSAST